MIFGEKPPKIVCDDPEITIDLSLADANSSFTEYDYCIPDYILHTSIITGIRHLLQRGSTNKHYAGFKIKIWGLSADDYENIYKPIDGEVVTFTPHADKAGETLSCIVLNVKPYYKDNLNFKDAVIITLISESYYDPLIIEKDWLSGWSYRKKITVKGESGAGTDYQIKLSIGNSAGGDFHLEGHCTDFPNDIRFTDNDKKTELKYWIEDITADPITVWVKVTDDLDSNQDIYVYYGKSAESTTSNGDNTFLFFDDFNDNSIDTDKWTVEKKGSTSAIVEETNQELHLAGEPNVISSGNLITKIFTVTHSIKYESKRKGTANHYRHMNIGYGDIQGNGGTDWWWMNFQYGYMFAVGDNTGKLMRWDDGSSIDLTSYDSMAAGDNTWYRESIEYDENGQITWKTNDYTVAQTTDTTYKDSNKYIFLTQGEYSNGNGGDSYFDWVFVRKCISTEPAYSSAGNEEEE